MLGRRLLLGRCPDRGDRLPGLLGQVGEDCLGAGRVGRAKSRSHFLEGRKVLGTRSEAKAQLANAEAVLRWMFETR
jgi:hypothetical protein